MARRKVQFGKGEYYHIYNRGANRRLIFQIPENYFFLLRRVKENSTKFGITVIAYCLMPNHYHFLLRQDGEISIAKFIQAIFNSYTKAFNKMFDRSGTLFEGPFKSVHVNRQEYLTYLCRYIHRNPIEGEKPLVKNLAEWQFSNYLEWLNLREGILVDRKFISDLFQKTDDYRKFVLDCELPKGLRDKLKNYFLD